MVAEGFTDVEINRAGATKVSHALTDAMLRSVIAVRLANAAPLTRAEFEERLAEARVGIVTLCDWGADQELWDAVEAVAAAAPNPPQALIDAARAAFAGMPARVAAYAAREAEIIRRG